MTLLFGKVIPKEVKLLLKIEKLQLTNKEPPPDHHKHNIFYDQRLLLLTLKLQRK